MAKTTRQPKEAKEVAAPKVVQIAHGREGMFSVLYDNGRIFQWYPVERGIGMEWREIDFPDITVPRPPKGYPANG